MNGESTITVTLVTRNRAPQLREALESIRVQSYPHVDIVVVDNASDDNTVEMLRTEYPDVTCVRLHANLGCPPARNIAMANATGDYVASLDDDGVFERNALEECLKVLNAHSDCGLVMMNIVEVGRERPIFETGACIPYFNGGAILLKRSVLESVGYYDDSYFRNGEERDFSIRLLDQGYTIRYCKEAIMEHRPEHRAGFRGDFVALDFAHKMLTLVKHAPVSVLLTRMPRMIGGYLVLLARKRALRHYFKGLNTFARGLGRALRSRDVLREGYRRQAEIGKTG